LAELVEHVIGEGPNILRTCRFDFGIGERSNGFGFHTGSILGSRLRDRQEGRNRVIPRVSRPHQPSRSLQSVYLYCCGLKSVDVAILGWRELAGCGTFFAEMRVEALKCCMSPPLMQSITIVLACFSLYYPQPALAISGNDWNRFASDSRSAYVMGVVDELSSNMNPLSANVDETLTRQ
jgi:hypothetical protein